MALIHCDFFSSTLKLSCSMCVILPQNTPGQIGMEGRAERKRHPVLWLLHGLSDDHTIWQRRTSIERYVAPLGLAVVMPAVNRSFYTDMKDGLRYWTYISEELPVVARSFFPLSEKREDNFVAGLSMGGYGAFKLALAHPERYAAAASLSGALDVRRLYKNEPGFAHEMKRIFGPLTRVAGTDNDLFELARRVARSRKPKPRLFQCCGTEDFLYDANIRFRDHARSLRLNITCEEGPGTHEWGYWDANIQRVLNWLDLKPGA